MRIVADIDIPAVADAFAPHGMLDLIRGRELTRESVRRADVLLVRSITRVDAALLDGSAIRFVASASAGIDHIDVGWLSDRGIAFACAPGCNSTAVSEYIAAAVLEIAHRLKLELSGCTLGVIGVGHVGSKVANVGRALGLNVLEHDPPVAQQTANPHFRPMEELFERANILTLHVPLTREGPFRTEDMVTARWLAQVRPGSILINSSRGDVADETALLKSRRTGRIGGLVLDVWRNEPHVNAELLDAADLATPHIAGYSVDARLAATRMIHQAFCRWAGVSAQWQLQTQARTPPAAVAGHSSDPIIQRVVRGAFDIAGASRQFKAAVTASGHAAATFDDQRRANANRLEFARWTLDRETCSAQADMLAQLGFHLG